MRASPFLLSALLVAACAPQVSVDPDDPDVDVDLEPVDEQAEVWEGTLSPTGGDSDIGGTVTARVVDDQTTVTVALSGATPGATHPWHIHRGSCGSGGPVVGPGGSYPVLLVEDDGTDTKTARLEVELNEAEDYYVNIHASPQQMGTIVACGALDD